MRIRQLVFIILLSIPCTVPGAAQDLPDSASAGVARITQKYISTVSDKSARIAEGMDRQTEKYLAKLEKQEARLKSKLGKIDSLAANSIFANASAQYQGIRNKIQNKSGRLLKSTGRYMPWLDSAGTSLKFLAGNNPLISAANGNAAKISGALGKVKQLEDQFKQAGSVKEFIRQRKEYLSEQLKNYNLGKELQKYNRTAFYFSQQVNDYKEMLENEHKAEEKALSLLRKLPAFQTFMKQNSMLAALFPVPDGYGTAQALQGLQTRSEIQGLLQGQLAAAGPNGQDMLRQNVQAGETALNSLKEKIARYGGGSSDVEVPDFKANTQKTKTFFQRLQYSTNIQTVKSNYFFPTTTDIALMVSYRLNQSNAIGIGTSCKMGWGKDIKHISLSGEGLGFRSGIDIKLKGSFYASAGLEYNYQQPFGSFEQLKYLDAWQQSGLIGISKIVSLKTKLFKKTKLQFLWDFLSSRQKPAPAQALKFRVEYIW